MAITHVSVTNFRSFKLLDLDLEKFNVFIGANASGKSNVVQILRFVRDISAHGLPNAVSMQGGTDYLRNVQIGPSIPLHIRIQSDAHGSIAIRGKIDGRSTLLGFRTQATDYSLELTFNRRGLGYTKTLDSAQADCDLFELRPTKAGHLQERRSLGRAHWEAAIERRRLVVNVTNLPPEVSVESDDLVPAYLRGYRSRLDPLDALIALPPALVFPLQQAFSEIAIYDLDPKL
ncbi:ATPase-like protein, partial [mine drainage metagenome]